ncbi:hypothetical protein IVB33_10015, partial [Bradyrhizobium sp. 24]|nr:hypothetical protein [Bradyrhizobium sp. 24]
ARYWYQGHITREVAYENHEHAAQLTRFDGLAATALKVVFKDKAPKLAALPEVAKLLGEREMHDYIPAFMDALPTLKSSRFKEENEYRIILMATQPGQTETDDRPYPPVSFREGANAMIIPYIELFKGSSNTLPIKKIIVGPNRDQANQYDGARLLLRQHGIDVPVVKSDTSLRY